MENANFSAKTRKIIQNRIKIIFSKKLRNMIITKQLNPKHDHISKFYLIVFVRRFDPITKTEHPL